MRNLLAAAIALAIAATGYETGALVLGGTPAHAVVGRPATPVSYAGVARRTSRRTTRRAVATGAVAPAPVATGYVTALPAGCAFGGGIYTCGAVRYRPAYSGTTVVYTRL